jgi:hypothetical protein
MALNNSAIAFMSKAEKITDPQLKKNMFALIEQGFTETDYDKCLNAC